jgi:hypothetical protein
MYIVCLVACRYEEYVPLKKRRQLEAQERLGRFRKVALSFVHKLFGVAAAPTAGVGFGV